MANSHLISQLAKLIENNYKQKTIIAHQLSVLATQELEKQIQSFETILRYIAPTFDFRQIRKEFDVTRLIQVRSFEQNIHHLIAQVFKQSNHWRSLYTITSEAMRIDKGLHYDGACIDVSRAHQYSIANVLRKMYKKGLLERQDKYLHYKIKKRGIFERSEWRIKGLVD